MRVYTNSAELDAQSERGISKSSAEKYICEKKWTTCADRLPDNHVVISEHCKSYYWKTSAQTSQKTGFGKINATIAGLRKHILLISCFMIETYTVGLFCSACVALELRTVWCRDKSKNMSAQPDQSDNGVIRRRDLGLKSHPKDREAGYRSCDPWVGSLACYPLHYCLSQPDRKIRTLWRMAAIKRK